MAEGIFNTLAKEKGLNYYAVSCGLSAQIPLPASSHAITAAAEYGADISRHTARQVNTSVLSGAAMIYCMTSAHTRRLKELFPEYGGIIRVMPLGEIPDPYMGSLAVYIETAKAIYESIREILKDLG
jgi:protein-tyrosine-phosphatase